MKRVTPTELRADIYNLLEEVLETGIPLEIRKGKGGCASCRWNRPISSRTSSPDQTSSRETRMT